MDDRRHTSELLRRTARGDESAASELFPLVYDRLRALAGGYMKGERRSHTLQPTALVHEAYIRMLDVKQVDWQDAGHFFAMAARQMRRVLIEHARSHSAAKRGGSMPRVTLDDGVAAEARTFDVIAIDEALAALEKTARRASQVAEMRLFAGMDVKECAAVLGVSERTVKGDWRMARAALANALGS